MISNVSRAFAPAGRSAVYRGGSWVRRMGRRVGSWVGAGIKLFGGVAVVTMSTVPAHVWANPSGEQVVGGAASFNRPDAATLIVNQQTDRAVINWNSFSIANGELTRFVQPGSSSAALNRVVTANPSQIYGTLQANGQIYLINPGGVMVGPGGVVDVAGFVASTHDIANEEFMRGGNLNFHGNSEASILNQGRVEAREGDVFLVAREVKNEGQLMAKDGTVGMVSGTEVSLQAVGQGNFKIRLLAAEDGNQRADAGGRRTEGGGQEAEIVNEGVIQAANAVLEAKGSYLPMAIKNTGLIEATGVQENGDGTVSLTGGEGDVLNIGVVAALQRSLDGQKETGGSVLMTGKNVTSDPGSIITAAGRDGGGTIKLRASDTTILRGAVEVVGTSESANGGQVQLLGERVGLFDQAMVDASGGAGGGEVLVGGDYLGLNPDVLNARITVTAPAARIFADATHHGDGGKIILWSEEYTGSHGNIFARGGPAGGNGGFVETSSKKDLGVFGLVNVGAPQGRGGTWLLDPADLSIAGTFTGNFGTATTNITFASATTSIEPNLITYALSLGNVTLQATDSITVSSSIQNQITTSSTDTPANTSFTASGSNTLFLQSGGKITIDANIDINSSINLSSSFNSPAANPTGPTAGDIVINGQLNSRIGTVTITANRPTQSNQRAGNITINSSVASALSTVTILAEAGNITLSSNLSAATVLNLTTGVAGLSNGGYIEQNGGVIRAQDLNAMTQNSVLPSAALATAGAHGLAWQRSSYIYLGSAGNEVSNVSLVTLGGLGALGQNNATTFDPLLARPTEAQTILYFRDKDDINIGTTTGLGALANRGIITAGSVNIVAGAGGPGGITQTQPIYALALGLEAVGNVTLPLSTIGPGITAAGNDILYLSGDTRATPTNGAFTYADRNGFNVSYAQTYWGAAWQGENTLLFGIRAGAVTLSALNGTEANGITLLNEPPFIITPAYQYTLLNDLPIEFTTRIPKPGHIESSRNVTITVGDPDTTAGNLNTRFTMQEGIHLFAGMNNSLSAFSGPSEGGDDTPDGRGRGIVTLVANNMTIGSDTLPGLSTHGLIMTGNINQSAIIDETSGVFLLPYGDGGVGAITPLTGAPTPNYDRPIYITSPKADYDVTADPGQLQLSMGEIQRINTSRLGLYSAFTDAGTGPAVEVRTALTLNGLYDVTKISGVFPNYAGANRLELWGFGGLNSNVQISADISTDTGSGGNNAALQVWLASANAVNTAAGTVNVNAGIRSYGGSIALQGDSVNINGLINANSTLADQGFGVVAVFPGSINRDMNLGTKQPGTLGILRDEVALVTAGTFQFGISSLSPEVLQPMSPVTNTFLVGSNPLWSYGNMSTLAGVNTGTLLISDLIADLSIDTLALLADNSDGLGFGAGQAATAMKQDNNNAGIRVPGLLIGGAPGTAIVAAPGTDYIFNSTLNQIDRLAVALTTTGNPEITTLTVGQDATGAGTPTGDVYLVNSKGLVGGNSGEVARRTQQWDQGLVLAGVAAAPLYTGIGLVAARVLAIVAAGPVAIYETLPAGVAGLGQYMGHVSADPSSVEDMRRVEVGNQIGVIGGSGTTVGLAVDARQNNPGESGANGVWAAAARGLAISDLSAGVFPVALIPAVSTLSGILTNGGFATLEGNAIEIIDVVARPGGGGTITIDTTGDGIAPAGAQVTIRPATGRNGFQDRLGSGAYDPLLENSILAGAPVEINLGTGSTLVSVGGAGTGGVVIPLIETNTGAITSYAILNAGSGYLVGDVLTVTANGPGAGASATVGTVGGAGEITSITVGAIGAGYGAGFLDASQDTLYISSAALSQTAIRASSIEIGQNQIAGTAAGKITVSSDLGDAVPANPLAFASLTQSLSLISGGAVVTSDDLAALGITLPGGLAIQSIGAVALRGDVDLLAVDTSGGSQNVRFIDSDDLTIGDVAGVSGVLAGTLFLQAGGNIAQSDGATIQATSVGLRATAGSIRLDQSNEFSLVAATAPGDVYLKTGFGLSISQMADGQPGGAPLSVEGITGANVTLVTGGTITQDGNAPVTASGAFLATVAEGSSVTLDASGNNFAQAPLVAALSAKGVLASANDVTIVNGGAGGIVLGQAGVLTVELLNPGSGYTSAPTVNFSTAGAVASPILGVGAVSLSSGGAGYLAAPRVQITGGGGVGATGQAVVDLNPLSATYGQITEITITNPGTGYTSLPTVTLDGGSPAQAATITGGTAAALVLQRINVTDAGVSSSYTTTPTVTLSGGGATTQGTATATIGGTAGYLPSGGTTILGGITGNLRTIASSLNGTITDGSGFSVEGTSTFGSRSGAINLNSPDNNLLGTITVGSNAGVTINNAVGSILGNFTGANSSGVPDTTAALGGALTLGSKGSIYQGTAGALMNVTGNATFLATSTALGGGTPNGQVIINNANNSFTGSVAATGTLVVIRDSTALSLGAVTASTSLVATSGSAGITQSGVINSTGAASFAAAANQSIILGDPSNVFGSTVSFSALTGQLQNVTVTDSTALDLQALNILGDLTASGAGLTQSGILQAANADLRSTGSGNSLNLATFNNNFSGEARIRSDGDASLFDNGPLIIGNGAASVVAGNLVLSSAGAFNQTQAITVNGNGTSSIGTTAGGVTFSQNISIANGNLTVAPATTLTQSGGTLSLTTGSLSIDATGLVQQTGGNMVVSGTTNVNSGGAAVTLTSATNDFQGAVTLTGGATTITDGVGGLTLGTINTGNLNATSTGVGGVLNLGQGTVAGTLTATSAGAITQSGVLNAGAVNLSVTQANSDILLTSAANNFTGAVTINPVTAGNVRDFALRNINPGAGAVGNLGNATTNLRDLTIIYNSAGYVVPTFNPVASLRNISITTGSAITQAAGGIVQGAGGTTFLNAGSSPITLFEAANNFTGPVTIAGTGVVTMQDANNLILAGQQSLNLGNITTGGAFTVSSPGNITSSAGSVITTGGAITLTAGSNADVIIAPASDSFLNSVTVPGTFILRTSGGTAFDLAGPGGTAAFDLPSTQLAGFNVGTFAPVAVGNDITISGPFNFSGIQNLSLTTQTSGNIIANGAVSTGTLSLSSAGTATFNAVNSISSLGSVSIGAPGAGLTFQNNRGLSLSGAASMQGRLSLEVAGQFYNQTGSATPLAGVQGGSVVKSLSLAGGLPNLISGLAGFAVRYDGVMPTSGNVMSYAVSPLTMFAPGGTVIAAVDLSGTQTGGGQLNTFFTGSDNLNWMIADFGKFNLPKVEPARMQYMLYQQRVEPETRSLPQPVMRELTMELGRPPTVEELQAREVAKRQAVQMRSGAILERSSFDEDTEEPKQEAAAPNAVIDGGRPQAEAGRQRPEGGNPVSEVGSRRAEAGGQKPEGLKPMARKQTDSKRDANGPMLRSGPRRAVALRAEPVDAAQIIQAERERAEVGVAPPVAATPR